MRLKALLVSAGAFLLIVVMGMRAESLPFIPRSLFSDVVVSHYPAALFLRQSVLEQQTFPLWRETIMAGQPFAANPLNKTAYPLQWLALLFPAALHINIMIALHLFIGGWGMWQWARATGLRQETAAFSAFAYAFAPRIIAHLGAGHVDVVYAMAWFPWLMWAVRQTITQPEHHLRNITGVGFIAALVFLADVRVSLFAFVTAGVYAIVLMFYQRQWKITLSFLVSGILFLVLSAALIAPLLGWSPYLSRTSLSIEDAGSFSMRMGDLISLIVPAHGVQHEQYTYFGLPVLLLAIIGITRQAPHQRWLWLAAIVFVVLYALGTSSLLWSVLVRIIPALLWFRVPARAWLILALLMPLLAGWGLQHLTDWMARAEPLNNIKRWRLLIFGVIIMMIFVGVSSIAFLRLLAAGGVGMLIIGVPLGVLMMLSADKRVNARRFMMALSVLLFVDLAWTGYHWAEWRTPETWLYADAPLAERLVSLNPQRIYSPTYSLEQQVAAEYGLRLFGGIDPFQLSGIVRAVEEGSGVPVVGYSIPMPPLLGIDDDSQLTHANDTAVIDAAVLGEWGVSHVVSGHAIEHPQLELVDVVDGVYIYANSDSVHPLSGAVPDWAEAWAGLPSAEEVTRLNEMTLTSAWVSGIAFVCCAGLLFVLKLRSHV